MEISTAFVNGCHRCWSYCVMFLAYVKKCFYRLTFEVKDWMYHIIHTTQYEHTWATTFIWYMPEVKKIGGVLTTSFTRAALCTIPRKMRTVLTLFSNAVTLLAFRTTWNSYLAFGVSPTSFCTSSKTCFSSNTTFNGPKEMRLLAHTQYTYVFIYIYFYNIQYNYMASTIYM